MLPNNSLTTRNNVYNVTINANIRQRSGCVVMDTLRSIVNCHTDVEQRSADSLGNMFTIFSFPSMRRKMSYNQLIVYFIILFYRTPQLRCGGKYYLC